MSLDPSSALQDAVGQTLAGALTCPVYDRVPAGAALPYCVIGQDQILGHDEYGDWSEAHVSVHIFSRAEGAAEVKILAGVARTALSTLIPITGFNVYEYALTSILYTLDPDGLTQHAVIEISYSIQPSG